MAPADPAPRRSKRPPKAARMLTPARAETLHNGAFYLTAIAYAVAAGTYDLPQIPFLVGLAALCGLYFYTAAKFIDPMLDASPGGSKEALALTDQEIIYTNWLGRSESLAWERLRRVGIARCESSFPDPWLGYYDEEYWFLVDTTDKSLQVPLELEGTEALRQAFKERLPDFDDALAEAAMASKARDHWLCWERVGA